MKLTGTLLSLLFALYVLYILTDVSGNQAAKEEITADVPEQPQQVLNSAENLIPDEQDDKEQVSIKSISLDDIDPAIKKLYKWRDENNIIVISMYPPEQAHGFEVISYFNEKTTQTLSIAEQPETALQSSNENASPDFISNPIKVYTPEGLRELILYSQEIGEKIELREKQLDDLINQL